MSDEPKMSNADLDILSNPFAGGDGLDEDSELDTLDRGDEIEAIDPDVDDDLSADGAEAVSDNEPSDDGAEDPEAADERDGGAEDSAGPDSDPDVAVDRSDDTGDRSDSGSDLGDAEKPRHSIPKPRFDAVNQRRKDAEARATAAEARLREMESAAASREDRVGKLDLTEALKEALAESNDGETDLAAEKLSAIMAQAASAARDDAAENKPGSAEFDAAVQKALDDREFDAVVQQAYADYPFLNPTNTDEFDAGLTDELVAMSHGLQDRHWSPKDALNQAIERILPTARPDEWLKLQGLEDADTPADRGGDSDKAKKVRAARKTQAVKKGAEAASKTPADLSSSDDDDQNATVDILTLSDEEFAALPASALRKLRGDFG